MANWFVSAANDEVVITVHVQPGARSTQVVGLYGDALKLRIAAPPVDGRANTCLVDFLAAKLNLPKSSIEIVGGISQRRKRVRLIGAPEQQVAQLASPND